jgi:hypothetical protein
MTTIADLQIQLQNQPAAGGGDVIMDYLNEDLSTWNYWDGDQNKVSYVWDAGNQVHNFTFAAGESSQLNYVGSTNTSSRVPVFYRPMTYADGSPVLNTDAFILQVQFDELEMAAHRLVYLCWNNGRSTRCFINNKTSICCRIQW